MISDVPADGHAWRVHYWQGGGFYGPLSEWIERIPVYRVTSSNALQWRSAHHAGTPRRHPIDLVFETEAEARAFALEKLHERVAQASAELDRAVVKLHDAEEAWRTSG